MPVATMGRRPAKPLYRQSGQKARRTEYLGLSNVLEREMHKHGKHRARLYVACFDAILESRSTCLGAVCVPESLFCVIPNLYILVTFVGATVNTAAITVGLRSLANPIPGNVA